MLTLLLEFHLKNKQYIAMTANEFEAYVNAILDRMNEIHALLKTNQ